MDKCKISKWEVHLGAPDRVNIPCLILDTRLCQLDVTMTIYHHGTKKDINTKLIVEYIGSPEVKIQRAITKWY